MHETELSFPYRSPERAALVAAALEPEMGAIDGDRTSVSLDRSGAALRVTIEASDVVALRAGQNTWLGVLEATERVNDAGRRFERD
ncbi:MAG: KEOPS complex subunit Pcc1 [Halodesulfurarchaeum sp.]